MPCPAAAIGIAAALALPGCGPAGAAAADIHAEPRAGYHTLSHDGSRMLAIREHRKGRHWDVLDTESGYAHGFLPHRFVRAAWGEDDDTAYAHDGAGKLYRLSFGPDGGGAAEIRVTGPGAVPADETPKVLSTPTPFAPFFLAQSTTGDRRLWRCDPEPAAGGGGPPVRCRVAATDGRNAATWLVSARGRVAARIDASETGDLVFRTLPRGGKPRDLFAYRNHYSAFTPIGPVQTDNTLWALSNRGRERVALVRLDLATGNEAVFFEHDRFDVAAATMFFDRAGKGTPLLATYDPDYQRIAHFDGRMKAAYAALLEDIGEPSRIDLGSIDLGRRYATVAARNPRIHRGWYLLDLERGTARALSASERESYARPAAPSRPVRFRASDGLELHGYLTLPEAREGAGPPPMVLKLHGGPWSRYRWPAGAIVRFLGAEGYAVLRLNFRGSAGYGRAFLEAGNGTLFGRLQQDVLDAAGWAVAEGHAARGRIAVYGGSFGGLLALAMLGRHPDAFRAGIALNAIADAVEFWRRDWKRPANRALWREFLGARDLPVAKLARISPLNNLDRGAAPVLLIAGAHDRRVPPSHSRDLFQLMRAAGKPVELVEYRGAAHNIWNAVSDDREHIVDAIGEFLQEHLPAKGG